MTDYKSELATFVTQALLKNDDDGEYGNERR